MLPWLIVTLITGVGLGVAMMWRSNAIVRNERNHLSVDLAETRASLEAEREKTSWIQGAKEQLRDTFKAVASDELQAKSEQLKSAAKEELGGLVEPLKKDLTKLDQYVRDLESKREGAYSQLGTQLDLLRGFQESLKEQTTTLVQALKTPTVRGRWGEIQLRRLVELAGLQDHVDFDEQASGDSGRPDMIVYFPQGGILPIDSKVSLGAFLAAMETEDEQARKQSLLQHAQTLRSRVKELSQKAYWDQFEKSPEFVVMFVPVEASLGAAFQNDPELFEYAIQNKVLVSSPVVLFGLLKAVAYGWQQQQISENAARIAEQGKTLYERAAKFVGHFADVGASLESCVKKYNDAVGSLEGRLLVAARRFREMGVGTTDIESPGHIELQPRIPAVLQDDEPSSNS